MLILRLQSRMPIGAVRVRTWTRPWLGSANRQHLPMLVLISTPSFLITFKWAFCLLSRVFGSCRCIRAGSVCEPASAGTNISEREMEPVACHWGRGSEGDSDFPGWPRRAVTTSTINVGNFNLPALVRAKVKRTPTTVPTLYSL